MSSFWLEKGSYALVGVLGLILCWRALKKLRALLQKPKFKSFTPHHVHHEKLRVRASASADAGTITER